MVTMAHSRHWREPLFLISPGLIFLVLAFFFPAFQMLALSLVDEQTAGLTLKHYAKVVQDDFYWVSLCEPSACR